MGPCFSSTIKSYGQLSNRSMCSSNSSNKTAQVLPTSERSVSLRALAEHAGHISSTTNGSVTAPIEIQLVDPPTATSNESATSLVQTNSVNPLTSTSESVTQPMEVHMVNRSITTDDAQNESKNITDLLQPASVASISLILLVNEPKSIKPNLLFPYNASVVTICISLFISIGLCMYALVKGTSKKDFAWLQKRVMIIATGSILISVTLRLFMVVSMTNMRYNGLFIIAIGGSILLYLWYYWSKANDLSQTTASSEVSVASNQV